MPSVRGDFGKRRRSREKEEKKEYEGEYEEEVEDKKKDAFTIIVVFWVGVKAILQGFYGIFKLVKVSFWHCIVFFSLFFSNFSTTAVLKCDTLTLISGGVPWAEKVSV